MKLIIYPYWILKWYNIGTVKESFTTYNLSILDFKYEKTNYFCRFVYVYLSTENSVNRSLKTRSL